MKHLLALILLAACTAKLSAQDNVTTAKWKPGQVVIDGIANEWPQPLNLYESSTGLQFAIANDSTHVYVCIATNTQANAKRLMKTGLDIELSSKEKNKKFAAIIHIPATQLDPGEPKGKEAKPYLLNQLDGFSQMVGIYKSQLKTMTTEGFATKNGQQAINDQNGIDLAVGHDSLKSIIYELSVPLKELYGANTTQLKEELTLRVNVKQLDAPASFFKEETNRNHGAGRGRNGMHRPGTSTENEPSNEENNGSKPERMVTLLKASFKQKFRLTGGE